MTNPFPNLCTLTQAEQDAIEADKFSWADAVKLYEPLKLAVSEWEKKAEHAKIMRRLKEMPDEKRKLVSERLTKLAKSE